MARLDVFGSALPDDFRPGESDLNPLIEFGPMQGYQKAVAYFDRLDDLQSLLGVDVDLVMKGALANPYLGGDRAVAPIAVYRVILPPTFGQES